MTTEGQAKAFFALFFVCHFWLPGDSGSLKTDFLITRTHTNLGRSKLRIKSMILLGPCLNLKEVVRINYCHCSKGRLHKYHTSSYAFYATEKNFKLYTFLQLKTSTHLKQAIIKYCHIWVIPCEKSVKKTTIFFWIFDLTSQKYQLFQEKKILF